MSKQAISGNPGQPLEHEADRREVVRLVQRRERHVAIEPREDGLVHPRGRHELEPAVHHAMPDSDDRLAVQLAPQEVEQHAERVGVAHRTRGQLPIDDDVRTAFRGEPRRRAEPGHLPAQLALEAVRVAAEGAELDARGAGVQDDDRLAA